MKFSQSWKVPTWDLSMLKLATSAFTVLNGHQPTVNRREFGPSTSEDLLRDCKTSNFAKFPFQLYTAHRIPCLHLVTQQQQPAAIQHNIKQSMERRQSGSETGCNAGPRDFSSKNEKYVKVLSIIFPNPRTGQNHTPAYNDNV